MLIDAEMEKRLSPVDDRSYQAGLTLIKTPDARQFHLTATGRVHELYRVPPVMEGWIYGYVDMRTFRWMGEAEGYNELYVKFDDPTQIQGMTNKVADRIEGMGLPVYRKTLPTPGEHPLNYIINTLMIILGLVAVLSMLLSALLVINVISALIAQQEKQIAIMKAIGARSWQIVGLYSSMVFILEYRCRSVLKHGLHPWACRLSHCDPSQHPWCRRACSAGFIRVGGTVITDYERKYLLTFPQVLIESSNVGTVQFAQRVSVPEFCETIQALGIGTKTGIDLPGEASGRLWSPERWTKSSLAHVAIGYEVRATPLHILRAMNVFATGGLLVRPRIVRSGAEDAEEPVRVISEKTASELVSRVFEAVVEEGTATDGRLDGYRIAGKTGTARKYDSTL